ncbi:MAG: insulinase family protein [Desulfovibrionaceae bacterium]|nr:insulinase family protein [Desulfovibrionaceae bacterium]MBF0515004.1 insulinase family protein [Desulfovibrionaceae bacterium]
MALSRGFETIFSRQVAEYAAKATLYRHAATGAQLLSVELDDENKVFGATFRTPPADSTGVAHILEHSVLCGSRKYPVKEPFVELIKGSLNTFLNAFTYPDKTCYPVASANLRDFYNLVDVYLDAVFFPRITEEIFLQEGWRLELPAKGEKPARKGVVYNEMKGAYSSPDSVLGEWSQRGIFPDTVYGLDSGGDPRAIPGLTYEQFRAFHAAYYHPANALIYFYGDDDPAERLRLAGEYLDLFGPGKAAPAVASQPRFSKPARIEVPYAWDQDSPGEPKGFVTVNWLLPEAFDPELVLAFELLEHILTGMSSSPLRKALIDSGLGEDLAGSGLETELRQMVFSIGLKGVTPGEHDRAVSLIFDTLRSLAASGITSDLVEAAVNSLEFDLRENNTGSFPRGLSLMLRALTAWLHGADPLAPVCFEAPLAAVKARLAAGEKLFEAMIKTHFLDNPHHSVVVLIPDPGFSERAEAEEAAQVAAELAAMDDAARKKAKAALKRLRAFQETPDSPEDLASIPRLTAADLPRAERPIPGEDLPQGQGVPDVFHHDLPTNGVVYLDLGFSLAGLEETHLPLVSLFGRALLEMGTKKEDFVSLTRRIARKTGGIWRDTLIATRAGGDGAAEGVQTQLFLRGKSTAPNAGALIEILSDILLDANLDDPGRFKQILLEAKAGLERRLAPRGHMFVSSRLRAGLCLSGAVAERMQGVEYLAYLRGLAGDFDKKWPQVREALAAIRQSLLTRSRLTVNLTADRAGLSAAQADLAALARSLPAGTGAPAARTPFAAPRDEGLIFPAQINFVGRAMRLYDGGAAFHGSHLVISRFLKTAYLWDHVRVRGGAYGAFCMLDRFTGAMTFLSYRDPASLATLEIFAKAGDYLTGLALPGDELEKAVIGAIGDIDAYMLPDAKGFTSLSRRLVGDDAASRERMRAEVLATTPGDFKRFGELLAAASAGARSCILGSRETIAQAAKAIPGLAMTDVS